MKITVLAENTAVSNDFGAEHGLSLLIESDGKKILFDMGQTDLFASNASLLGINLSDVDIAFLSHGHYDHGGGLKKFLEANTKTPVYINKHAFEPHYNGAEKYIGLDTSLSRNPRLIYIEKETAISDNLIIYPFNENKRKYALTCSGLNMMEEGIMKPDDFRHEQYLLIRENEKKILISGCSHNNILNIAEIFRPDVLIGGFHFSKLPLDDQLKNFAVELSGFDTDFYTCHCTGIEQFKYMKQYIDRLDYISAGSSFEICT